MMCDAATQPLTDLLRAAMAAATPDGWSDEALDWEAVDALRGRLDRETLEALIGLTRDSESRPRRLGAMLIGQFGHVAPDAPTLFPEERFAALRDLLADERAGPDRPEVLASAAVAFGHLGDARCVVLVSPLAGHPVAGTRLAAAMALATHDDALDALIGLSRDEDAQVRDWATFALGRQTTLDTPALRDALRARLDDADFDTMSEAVAGLAARGDGDVAPALARALTRGEALDDPSLLLEAARRLADPSLLAALRAARQAPDWPAPLLDDWAAAVAACGGDPKES
jgi:hypothetical protein